MSKRMLARYYLLPTIERLSLCTVEWRIFITRLFGDLFRMFQSCPYNYQTNGARVRATIIVGIITEPELGGKFYNAIKGKVLCLTLEEMGWKQGPTTIFVDNKTASGICNSTIKQQRSRAMNGQYFWLIDQVNLNTYRIKWAPGLENMADYSQKNSRQLTIVTSGRFMCTCKIHRG